MDHQANTEHSLKKVILSQLNQRKKDEQALQASFQYLLNSFILLKLHTVQFKQKKQGSFLNDVSKM